MGVYPNKVELSGDKVVVSGFASSMTAGEKYSVEVLLQDLSGEQPSGKGTSDFVAGSGRTTDFSVTLTANKRPGTFTPGSNAIIASTLKKNGSSVAKDETMRRIEGGSASMRSLIDQFNDPNLTISLPD